MMGMVVGKKVLGLIVGMAVCGVSAGPVEVGTKSEVQAAKGLIDDLVESGVGAEKLLSMAEETENGPQRYWLYANAFIKQVKEEKYAEAAETIKSLRTNVTGIPEVNIVNLIEKNVGKKVSESPELAAALKASKSRLAAQRLVTKVKQDIRKRPKDGALKVVLGEALAASGDWDAALKTFAEAKGKVSDIAKAETEQKRTMKIAGFWWDYQPCRELASSKAFKEHAAEIYRILLDADKLSLVEKTLAEKRISQMSARATAENAQPSSSQLEEMTQELIPEKVILIPTAERGGVECRYTFQMPRGDWKSLKFDDSRWKKGKTSFGDCDNATYWNTGDVWIRYVFDCNYDSKNIESAIFRCIVDDDMKVWLNEKEIFSRQGVVKQYMDWPSPGIMDCLRRGKNILVVHAHDIQNGNHPRGWGEFVDFGLEITVSGSAIRKTAFRGQRNVTEPSKVNGLSELKKICDTKGLVHCWRFNGDLRDEVGGGEAQCYGNARIEEQRVTIFGGPGGESGSSVALGANLIPNDGSSVTLELWAAQQETSTSSRIFSFGEYEGAKVFMSWSFRWDMNRCEVAVWDDQRRLAVYVPANYGFAPFNLGIEYHIALVFVRRSEQSWELRVYKQDAQTGQTIRKVAMDMADGWTLKGFSASKFHLGKSYGATGDARDGAANASYNEVRIWNRALDEDELTQNAINFHKAGETMKTSGVTRRYVGGGNSSGRETRQQSKLPSEELKKIIDAENAYDKKMLERKFGKGGQR